MQSSFIFYKYILHGGCYSMQHVWFASVPFSGLIGSLCLCFFVCVANVTPMSFPSSSLSVLLVFSYLCCYCITVLFACMPLSVLLTFHLCFLWFLICVANLHLFLFQFLRSKCSPICVTNVLLSMLVVLPSLCYLFFLFVLLAFHYLCC